MQFNRNAIFVVVVVEVILIIRMHNFIICKLKVLKPEKENVHGCRQAGGRHTRRPETLDPILDL